MMTSLLAALCAIVGFENPETCRPLLQNSDIIEPISNKIFDTIFIEGSSNENQLILDIYHCQQLAHQDTIVWINHVEEAYSAIIHCHMHGLVDIVEHQHDWIKLRYQYLSREAKDYFTRVYDIGLWGKNAEGQGTSGPGSSMEQGRHFIEYINIFLQKNPIQTVVDVGCGDWVLAKAIDWGNRHYLGLDIVDSVVKKNQALHTAENVQFAVLDAGAEPIPPGDLLICKDVLMHLPFTNIFHILEQAKKFKFAIFVNDVYPEDAPNIDRPSCGFRPLDLTKPPFNLIPEHIECYTTDHAIKQIVLMRSR
jgi:SAM-dependent methyltransferase